MAVIGILLIIGLIELYVHQPFKGFFKAIRQYGQTNSAENIIDMNEVITDSDPYLGAKNAKIQIVEFADFACPYCQAASSIFREVMIEYEDEVFYQYRDYPIVTEQSMWLAMAAACAHEQGKFWPFHDKLYQNQGQVSPNNIYQLAQTVGLKKNQFKNCLDNEKYKNEVLEDFLAADQYAAQGTPTFFINGRKFPGSPTKESLKKMLDQLIEIYDKGD